MLGDQHLRVATVRGFPTSTWPGILDDLNRLSFGYRWSTRFLCMDKADAERAFSPAPPMVRQAQERHRAIARNHLPAGIPLVDTDASNKSADADAALGAGQRPGGLWLPDGNRHRHGRGCRRGRRSCCAWWACHPGRGFVTIPETLNAVDAWLSSIPGHAYANVRQPIVSTLNLAHLVPVSAVWAGPEKNAHLDGPPLIVTRTEGATPFRLVTHIGDVGHAGGRPTGMGKSVLLATLAMQFRRYRGSRVFAFDMGRSMRATIWAWAVSTTTSGWMARSPSSPWPVSTARATAGGRMDRRPAAA